MATIHEDDEVGFEEGMLWCLPSHVLRDLACYNTTKVDSDHDHHRHKNHQQLRPYHKISPEPHSQQSKKCRAISHHHRTKNGNGGSGMQAIFLESGHRSSGTGVFLPQTAGIKSQPKKKPACAPVLVPERVVQALNLNVHTIGLQVSPPKGSKHVIKPCGDVYSSNSSKRRNGDEKDGCGNIQHNQNIQPTGIFLPKEWTY